jgi:hypothetical protein
MRGLYPNEACACLAHAQRRAGRMPGWLAAGMSGPPGSTRRSLGPHHRDRLHLDLDIPTLTGISLLAATTPTPYPLVRPCRPRVIDVKHDHNPANPAASPRSYKPRMPEPADVARRMALTPKATLVRRWMPDLCAMCPIRTGLDSSAELAGPG